MTSREDSVLAARDPSLVDENDWEEFSLSEVRILVPGKSRYANLLSATPENPVQVTGCLEEVEEEQEGLVLDPEYLTKRLVMDNVSHFAYGQHNDGEVGIWVAGRAGWFSISPAKGYRAMFNEVVEAIDLLYFLTDRHKPKRRRKRNWNPSVEYLCDEYVLHTHGICEDGDDSAEVFYKHHYFLLSRMMKGEEEVNWPETNVFVHLCEKFSEDYEEIRAQKESKDAETGGGEDEEEQEDEDEEIEDQEPERAPTPDPTTISKAQADAIYRIILELKEAGHLAKRQLNLELVASTMMTRFEIDTSEYAQNLISSTAATILDSMNEAKTNTFDWSKKVIYRELKAASKNASESVAFTPLRPRLSEDDNSSEDESEHEEQPGERRPRHRKSVLRPKSQVATKRTGKRTRSAAAEYDLSDENPDAMDEFETPSKVRGHDLVRDPLSTRAKRRTRSILSDSEQTLIAERTPLQETLQSRNTSVSAAEHLPELGTSHDNNGSSDMWICQVPGCGKTIVKSTSKRGKEMVQDHSLAHADDTKAKVDLVIAEQRLNFGLRVDNLLSRIQGMGALDGTSASLNGQTNGAHDEIGT
ncbi:hypothetical protein BDW59DRAFT_29226 [Aspergillus cavernicola]|uniref:DNA (cytosine-5)-methyltransferase 1 replication foci domain-containing protein n=1 Tax=Aspergillus cavernicola TaxID=176166 RepID=A0ABR4IQN8_9EURO